MLGRLKKPTWRSAKNTTTNLPLLLQSFEVIESKVNAEVAPVDENLNKPFEKKLADVKLTKKISQNNYIEDKATEEKASIGSKEIYDKQNSNQGGANKVQVGVKVMEAFEQNLETHQVKINKFTDT